MQIPSHLEFLCLVLSCSHDVSQKRSRGLGGWWLTGHPLRPDSGTDVEALALTAQTRSAASFSHKMMQGELGALPTYLRYRWYLP